MKKLYILILLSATTLVALCESRKRELVLKLEEGEEYRHIISLDISVTQNVDGQKINIPMTISMNVLYFVKSADDDGYEMEVKYESLGMSMQVARRVIEFSSEKNDEHDFFSVAMAAIKNRPFTVKMSTRGEVIDIESIESIFNSVVNFSKIPEVKFAEIEAQLSEAYGTESLKGSIEMLTAILPDKPVSIGEKWTVATIFKGIGVPLLNVATTYGLVQESEDYVLLNGESKVETEEEGGEDIELNGVKVKYSELVGVTKSEIKLNKNTGWIIEAKINQKIASSIHIAGNSQMPDGMRVPMVLINKMTITDGYNSPWGD